MRFQPRRPELTIVELCKELKHQADRPSHCLVWLTYLATRIQNTANFQVHDLVFEQIGWLIRSEQLWSNALELLHHLFRLKQRCPTARFVNFQSVVCCLKQKWLTSDQIEQLLDILLFLIQEEGMECTTQVWRLLFQHFYDWNPKPLMKFYYLMYRTLQHGWSPCLVACFHPLHYGLFHANAEVLLSCLIAFRFWIRACVRHNSEVCLELFSLLNVPKLLTLARTKLDAVRCVQRLCQSTVGNEMLWTTYQEEVWTLVCTLLEKDDFRQEAVVVLCFLAATNVSCRLKIFRNSQLYCKLFDMLLVETDLRTATFLTWIVKYLLDQMTPANFPKVEPLYVQAIGNYLFRFQNDPTANVLGALEIVQQFSHSFPNLRPTLVFFAQHSKYATVRKVADDLLHECYLTSETVALERFGLRSNTRLLPFFGS